MILDQQSHHLGLLTINAAAVQKSACECQPSIATSIGRGTISAIFTFRVSMFDHMKPSLEANVPVFTTALFKEQPENVLRGIFVSIHRHACC